MNLDSLEMYKDLMPLVLRCMQSNLWWNPCETHITKSYGTRVIPLVELRSLNHFLGESMQYFDGTRIFDRFYPLLVELVCDFDDAPIILDRIQVGL